MTMSAAIKEGERRAGGVYKIAAMQVGWVHSSLSVASLDRGIEFYSRAFGGELLFAEELGSEIAETTGIDGMRCRLAQMRFPGSTHVFELIEFLPPRENQARSPTAVGHGHVAFHVEALEAALNEVEALGAERVGTIVRFPEGRAIYMREPAGSVFELTEIDPDAVSID